MHAIERRQYEMLLRLRDFANTHRDRFTPTPAAQLAFDAINRAIDALTAADLLKRSASASSRGNRKATARKALIELLVRVSQLSRVLRAQGHPLPAFALPASKSDQALLTTARQFARDAAPFDTEFAGHGMGSTRIAGSAAAFERASRDHGRKRADHTEARVRIHALLTGALLDARRLDLVVVDCFADSHPIRAVWKQARHVDTPRRSRARSAAQPSAPVEAIGTPTSATVIEMPALRVASAGGRSSVPSN